LNDTVIQKEAGKAQGMFPAVKGRFAFRFELTSPRKTCLLIPETPPRKQGGVCRFWQSVPFFRFNLIWDMPLRKGDFAKKACFS